MRVVTFLGAAAAVVAVAGCSTGTGTASPPPVVLDDLNLTPYVGKPCTFMRPDQLRQHRVTSTGKADGAACRWTPDDTTQPAFQVSADVTSGGLDQLRVRRKEFAVFDSTVVSGYPAVKVATSADAPRHGHCTVDVGVAKTGLLVVTVDISDPQAPDYADACHQTDIIATSVIANIKEGSP